MTGGEPLGEVVHYFNKIKVAVTQLDADLKIGDQVHFHGATTDFTQEVTSMQIEHEEVTEAKAGQEVAIKVKERVRKGDQLSRPEDEV